MLIHGVDIFNIKQAKKNLTSPPPISIAMLFSNKYKYFKAHFNELVTRDGYMAARTQKHAMAKR